VDCRLLIQAEAAVPVIDIAKRSRPVRPPASGPKDLKPVTAEPATIAAQPFRLQRRRKIGLRPKRRYLLSLAAAGGFLIIGLVLLFALGSQRVTLDIDPTPERTVISGGWAHPHWNETYFLLPGDYQIQVSKPCFQTLSAAFSVKRQAMVQEINLKMVEAPGRLDISTYRQDQPDQVVHNALVFIDQQEVGRTPLASLSVAAGRHELVVETDRYERMLTEVQVQGCDRLQQLKLLLSPAWAEVTVASRPAGARIYIDGAEQGLTPLTKQMIAGEYTIALKADSYKLWQKSVTVVARRPQTIGPVELQLQDARLKLSSIPSEASVLVDTRYAGRTPLNLSLTAQKTHRIELRKNGFQTVKKDLVLAAAEDRRLEIELKAITGLVNLQVRPADATLHIGKRRWQPVPRQLALAAFEQRLRFERAGYIAQEVTLTPQPGFAQNLSIDLKPVSPLPTAPQAAAPVIEAPGGYRLVLVKPGAFSMGSSRREQGRRSNETLRRVILRRPFYMGAREVTNHLFRQFAARHRSGSFKQLSLNNDDLPVVMVTWTDAARFCNWLSEQADLPPAYRPKGDGLELIEPVGTGFRLPSEAEWAYCARFGSGPVSTRYPWGATYPPPARTGNFADESAKKILGEYIGGYRDGFAVSAVPANFKANGLNLFDLAGNVAEWCHDYYTIYITEEKAAAIDPFGPVSGNHHVVRGSSWKHAGISLLRTAYGLSPGQAGRSGFPDMPLWRGTMRARVLFLTGLCCTGLFLGAVSPRWIPPEGAVTWVWAPKIASAQTTPSVPPATGTDKPPTADPGPQPQAGSGTSAGNPPAPAPFTPEETIEADEAVDFPVDI
jgi:formylglycine-generating enzyme required for sulfatase activity